MSDAGAGAAGGTNTNTASTSAPWYSDLDEAHRGHVVAKGWDKMDPAAAARAAAQSHRELQSEFTKKLGVPPDQILRWPTDAADPGWAEIHKRLGRPDKPEDYKIEGVKFADGKEPDGAFIGHMRALAHELNLPADKAAALAQRVIALADNDRTESQRTSVTQRAANDTELRRAWGANHDYYRFQTTRAAETLGIPADVVTAMEGRPAAEYLRFMDSLRGLAGKMGEAELLRGEGGGENRALTREEAVARLEDLRRDAGWSKRFLSGDVAAKTELENLTRIMVGQPPGAAPPARR